MAGNIYDQIINGSFDAVGAPPSYITPAYNPADYASIYAKPTGGITPAQLAAIRAVPANSYMSPTSSPYSPYMTAAERAQLDQQIAQSKALQAAMGNAPTSVATGPAWNTPTRMDLAAIEAANRRKPMVGPTLDDLLAYAKGLPDKAVANPAVAATTAAAMPADTGRPGKPKSRGGGLFELLFGGQSGNSTGGLAGIFGGPGSGGRVKTGPSGVGTNGYTYVNGQNMGYSPAVQAQRTAQGKAIGDANRKNPNPTYTVSGDRNDFMPTSVQNSVRWQTGY